MAVLGSGSSGNCALVSLGETRVLIDAGLSAKQICLRLEALGVDPDELSAIVLTHEHGDHTRGIDVFCRKRALPIYATLHTCAVVRENVSSPVIWTQFDSGSGFEIGSMKIESFSVPHDAVDPVGFVFRCEESSLGVLSDVGHVTRMIVDRLKGVDTLFTEANYDEKMLQEDTKRPWSTKQRISNRHGHLSNDQTAELVGSVAGENLKRVVLGHLSSDCNTPELAAKIISQELGEQGFGGVTVECADSKEPLPLESVAHPPAIAPKEEAPISEENAPNSPLVCEPSPPETGAPAPSLPDQEWRQTEWVF
ncbi:MBL fold metallo-hydrolase [Verrucomicrobiales bacterium]|nr:MBL fold metallo-hydrolase [Verrucomicrobiales bacterium]